MRRDRAVVAAFGALIAVGAAGKAWTDRARLVGQLGWGGAAVLTLLTVTFVAAVTALLVLVRE